MQGEMVEVCTPARSCGRPFTSQWLKMALFDLILIPKNAQKCFKHQFLSVDCVDVILVRSKVIIDD
jgi:hypothetical protein